MPESGNRYVRFQARQASSRSTMTPRSNSTSSWTIRLTVPEIPPEQLPFPPCRTSTPAGTARPTACRAQHRATSGAGTGACPGHGDLQLDPRADRVQARHQRRAHLGRRHADRPCRVCRDFAHLGIALCRALGIPARFVSCYAWRLDPPDFHAVFEAYLGGRWYLFDSTRQAALGRAGPDRHRPRCIGGRVQRPSRARSSRRSCRCGSSR